MTERTHYVYDAYDADGEPLYVGCTGNPTQRYRQHMSGNGDARGWFEDFVTHWRVSGPYPGRVARQIERERIELLQPIYNAASVGGRDRSTVRAYLARRGVQYAHRPNRHRPYVVPITT